MTQTWQVLYYTTESGDSPVVEFIKHLPCKDQAKLLRVIDLLQQHGSHLRMPFARPIEGERNLYELRSSFGNNTQRVFYCHFTGHQFVLLHGFSKKSQKTPVKEIVIAKARQKEYVTCHPPGKE